MAEVATTSIRFVPPVPDGKHMNDRAEEVDSPGSRKQDTPRAISALLLVRAALGGVLMGLANLVPGISGGTMLLAAGVYPEFVESVSAVTRLVRRWRPWIVLAAVAVPALLAIGLLAGTIRDAVLEHRWIAYSLFIGLTLGGAPTLLRMIKPLTRGAVVSAIIAFCGMVVLAILQETGQGEPGLAEGGILGLGIAGFAGASAMVLPGVSGGYLLLVLGQYVAVLDAISSLVDALKAGSIGDAVSALPPILAIGVGVVLGIVLVSNGVRWLLHHHRHPTLGVLLGLLLGAVAGLWPYRTPVVPEVGSHVRGVLIENELQASEVPLKHRPTIGFTPTPLLAGASIGLVLIGLGVSIGVSRLGGVDGGDDHGQEESGSGNLAEQNA